MSAVALAPMNQKEIRELIDDLIEKEIAEFELERGDVKLRGARAGFCLNFFGCAGFEIVEGDQLQEADLVVLCSSDPEYLALAQEVCPKVKAPVLVAGNPKDQLDALKTAGVQGFVHIQSDAVETLTQWQDRLGLRH